VIQEMVKKKIIVNKGMFQNYFYLPQDDKVYERNVYSKPWVGEKNARKDI
jgi:hypothetical protein